MNGLRPISEGLKILDEIRESELKKNQEIQPMNVVMHNGIPTVTLNGIVFAKPDVVTDEEYKSHITHNMAYTCSGIICNTCHIILESDDSMGFC